MDRTLTGAVETPSNVSGVVKDTVSINAHPAVPVAHLRVLEQQNLEEADYPIYTGECSIGRDANCELHVEALSLSRKHATFLVESGTHFLQDNGSRNKTYRGLVELRPNCFYELTDGCELTFADVHCRYIFGPPPKGEEEEEDLSGEQTQAYDVSDEEEEEEGKGAEPVADEKAGSEEGGGAVEATVAYQQSSGEETGAESGEEQGGGGMECEPTIAYNLGGDDFSDEEESGGVSSPPLLTANTAKLTTANAPDTSLGGDTEMVGGGDTEGDTEKVEEDTERVEADTEMVDAADAETDVEEGDGEGPCPVPVSNMADEPTVPYHTDTDDEEGKEKEEVAEEGMEGVGEGGAEDGDAAKEDLEEDVKKAESSSVKEDKGEKSLEAVSTPVSTPQSTERSGNSTEVKRKMFSLVPYGGRGRRGGGRGGRGRGRAAARRKSSTTSPVEPGNNPSLLSEESPGVSSATTKAGGKGGGASTTVGTKPQRRGRATRGSAATTTPVLGSHDQNGKGGEEGAPSPVDTTEGASPRDDAAGRGGVAAATARGGKGRKGVRSKRTTQSLASTLTEEDDAQESEPVTRTRRRQPAVENAAKKATTSGSGTRTRRKQPAIDTDTIGEEAVARAQPDDTVREESPDVNVPAEANDSDVDVLGSGGEDSELKSHDNGVKSHDQDDKSQEEDKDEAKPPEREAASSRKRGRGTRGRGGAGRRGKAAKKAEPVNASPKATPTTLRRYLTPTHTPKASPAHPSRPSPRVPAPSPAAHSLTPSTRTPSPAAPEQGVDKPKVMFTGMIDKKGEKTVRDLGGELVDSVYQCTHLVTEKVRRTVKFLCCLSRGCLIVDDHWLTACSKAGYFLPAKAFLVKDKASEKQHSFSLAKSLESAMQKDLLSGYQVHLTPNLKPEREQMSDIIRCSGGDPVEFSSPPTGENVLVVACDEDLDLCKEAMDAGVKVHSAELILGGVLRQELDFNAHLLLPSTTANSRKRRAKETASTASASKKRRK